MKLVAVFLACVVLAGCAATPTVVASTPRSIEIHGVALTKSDDQKAFDMAQSECQKYGRHASLTRSGGTKLEAKWNFDCVQ